MDIEYQVGDVVVIKDDLHEGEDYDFYVNDEMEKAKGQIAKITHVMTDDDHDFPMYSIDIDSNGWIWTADMFEFRDIEEIVEIDLSNMDSLL